MRPPEASPLLTDLYQLTMLQAYHLEGMEATAVFEFFVRRLPPSRNFLVAAGLEQVLDFLEGLAFTPEEIDALRGLGGFRDAFLRALEDLRFRGDVHALPEGTPFFPGEPVLRVTAPLPQAQLVETRLINLLHFQILVASKAARVVLAAPGKTLVDFGLRRAHGAEAGLLAARAGYLAGLSGTSTVLAGVRFGIPVFGTMAHSFVQAHESEAAAFEAFARAWPENAVLLIDTYDTEAAAHRVAALVPRLRASGVRVRGVRIDSGDLAAHAAAVRRILDAAGLDDVRIFASGNLDEAALARLLAAGAPIDGFGVGTRLDTSADAPSLDCAYKLQEYDGVPRRKRSEGKATLPGRKQVFRRFDDEGRPMEDVVGLEEEDLEGTPLLVPVMRAGRRLFPAPSLDEIRARTLEAMDRLPPALRSLDPAPAYPVRVSPRLAELARQVDARTARSANRDTPGIRTPAEPESRKELF